MFHDMFPSSKVLVDRDASEEQRLTAMLVQPKQHKNYTAVGFKKTKAPLAAWQVGVTLHCGCEPAAA